MSRTPPRVPWDRHPTRRLLKRFVGLALAITGLAVLGIAGSALASHGRGTTLSVSVATDGTATVILDQRTVGSCTVGQPAGGGNVTLYSLDVPGGTRVAHGTHSGSTICRRTAGGFIETRTVITIPMGAEPDGWYVVRHESGAKVANIINVNNGESQTNWSSEAQFQKVTNAVSGSPSFGVDLPFAAAIGFPYNQNLAVSDPDGGAVTTRTLCCNIGDPDYAVTYDVITVQGGVVADNQIVIPQETTAGLALGQYLEFKVRVTDDEGEYSDLDMVLSPTENDPPTFPPPEQTTYEVTGGGTTTIPLEASDPDPGQSISFSLSGQPSWITLNQTPGNPATGTITVNPPPTATGTFVVNVNANDNDPSLQSTSSFTLSFQVAGVPDAPQELSVTQGDAGVTVAWNPPLDTGTAVTGYRVEYREVGSGDPFTPAEGSTSPTVITGLEIGRQYEVRVVGLSANGDGIPATALISPIAAPGAVTDVTVQPTTTGAGVSWQAPASNGGSPITGYLVEHRAVGSATWTSSGEVTGTSINLSGLGRGVAHEVRIGAVNAAGASAWTTASFRTLGLPTSGSSSVVVVVDGRPVTAPLYTGPRTGSLVSVAGTPTGAGSWATTAAGHVYTAGDATFHGSLADVRLNSPITGIAPTITGDGYYLVAADGGVFAFGDADFHGSMGAIPLNQPVQGLVPTCGGDGYYLVALDGGVFAFGDATFHGSMGGTPLNRGMLGILPDCDRGGYWTFAADGGVFSFGNSVFFGSLGGNPPAAGVVAMSAVPDGQGYWLIAGDGTPYPFGSAGS